MPIDPTMQAMLVSYDKTAQRLMDGDKIEGDERYRFLGITGVLSVQMQQRLWTQEELREQIETAQAKRCETCPNSKAIAALTAASAKPVVPLSAPDSKQDVWAMIATSVAQNMKTLIICVFAAITVMGVTVIATKQIAEAANAGVAITNAAQDK